MCRRAAATVSCRLLICVDRSQKAPWNPSLSLAFRLLVLIRVMGAMYSNINDCDEGNALLSCAVPDR